MRIFDESSFLLLKNSSNEELKPVVDISNNYLLFERDESKHYESLVEEIKSDGRAKVDWSKYYALSKEPIVKADIVNDNSLDIIPAKHNKDPEVLKILKELSQPNSKLTLNKSKLLFLEVFKSYHQ